MKYAVLWDARAEADLAAVWLAAADRHAVARAAHWFDAQLARAPLRLGESRASSVHRLAFYSPPKAAGKRTIIPAPPLVELAERRPNYSRAGRGTVEAGPSRCCWSCSKISTRFASICFRVARRETRISNNVQIAARVAAMNAAETTSVHISTVRKCSA